MARKPVPRSEVTEAFAAIREAVEKLNNKTYLHGILGAKSHYAKRNKPRGPRTKHDVFLEQIFSDFRQIKSCLYNIDCRARGYKED